MHAVVFQFRPFPEQHAAYFALVAALRPELARIEGFLANERFTSADEPGWLLSLSLWQDETAIARWRCHAEHRSAQERGKAEILAGYRLRVGEVLAGSDEAVAAGPAVLRLAIGRGLTPVGPARLFRGLNDPDRLLLLGGDAATGTVEQRLMLRVVRDYGRGGVGW